jgi:hypothetical protein
MKNISQRLKKTAPLVLLGLILDCSPAHRSAQALVGGPFDDNNFPGVNADGTYSGTVSGHNLTGIVSFGVSSSSEAGGRFSIFHEGFVHYGAATGIADLASRRIAGSLLGVAPLGGAGFPTQVQVPTFFSNVGGITTLNTTTVTITPPGVTETQGGSGTLASALGGSLTVRSALEGSFTAQMKGYPNQIKFEGSGRLATNANTAVVTTPPTAINAGIGFLGAVANQTPAFTVTFPSPGAPGIVSDAPTPDNKTPGSGDTVSADAFPQRAILRTETPFKIRGSRTSRQVYTANFNYTATAPITLVASTPIPSTPGATPATTPTP